MSMCTVHKHEHEHESQGQEVSHTADSSSGDCLDSNSKTKIPALEIVLTATAKSDACNPNSKQSSDHLCVCVLQDATGTEGVLQTSL